MRSIVARRLLDLAERIPLIGARIAAARAARRRHRSEFPPGHFHSPIPDPQEIQRDADRLFGRWPPTLPGIDLNEEGQLTLLEALARYYGELPFPERPTPPRRYYFENPMYSYSDAIVLYAMLRHLRPRRLIEVGSGFSSAVMLDTNELFLDHQVACTFIEPHPERLLSLMSGDDRRRVTIISRRLQDVELGVFAALDANDILFIDSSHVLKVGSDVQRILSEIVPALRTGVYIHFHDVFFPFEYPRQWIERGRHWTEAYALRAFLQFNPSFQIVLFNTYLSRFHRPTFERRMPLCLRNEGGSIWLRRTG